MSEDLQWALPLPVAIGLHQNAPAEGGRFGLPWLRLRRRRSSSFLCRVLNTLSFTPGGLRCPQSFPAGADSSFYLVHKGSHAFRRGDRK